MSAEPEPWPKYLEDQIRGIVEIPAGDREFLVALSRLIWAHEQNERCVDVEIGLGDAGDFHWNGERFEKNVERFERSG